MLLRFDLDESELFSDLELGAGYFSRYDVDHASGEILGLVSNPLPIIGEILAYFC